MLGALITKEDEAIVLNTYNCCEQLDGFSMR